MKIECTSEELKTITTQEESKITVEVDLGHGFKTKEDEVVAVKYISALKHGIEKECNCACTLLVKMSA